MMHLPVISGGNRVDVIWNMTLVCPWDCEICCVDAVHVRREGPDIVVSSASLSRKERIPHRREASQTIYDVAARHRQEQGLELDFAGKLRVLDHLEGFAPKIDISGGDPLSVRENFEVMQRAATRYGVRNVTLTATGTGLMHHPVESVAPHIGEFNFTYDNVAEGDVSCHRPKGYARGNLHKAAQFARLGVPTRAECPLTIQNLEPETLDQIYTDLHEAGIRKLLVMRLFAVGRGAHQASATPSPAQYRHAIAHLRRLESRMGFPAVRLQCALKHLDPAGLKNPCDLVRESFGLMADGTLLASPWAIRSDGLPLDESFVLGNLAQTPLREILTSGRVNRYRSRLDENFGHCKIFSFFNGTATDAEKRLFERADPLFTHSHDEPRN